MVSPSKLFEWPLSHLHCSQLPIHCGKSCFQSGLYDFYTFTISGLKYFSPLILTPLALKRKDMSLDKFKDTLKFYFQTVLVSSATVTSIFVFLCIFRNLSGQFRRFTSCILPTFIAGQFSWLFPKSSRRIFVMATTQVALESLLRQHKNAFTHFLLNSRAMQTLIFMFSSAIIMHFKRKGLYRGFWFVSPAKPNVNNEELTADPMSERMENIWKYLSKDFKTYLTYGLSLDVLNVILKKYGSHKSNGLSQVLWSMLKGLRFNMTCFFISYVAFYKLGLRYLPSFTGTLTPDLQHAMAAFFGGASYAFLNKLTCNTFACILAVQISWQNYCQKLNESNEANNYLNVLKNIPFGNILFPFSITYIVNSLFFNKAVNSSGKQIAYGLTNYKFGRILEYFNKHELDFILKDASLRPYCGAF